MLDAFIKKKARRILTSSKEHIPDKNEDAITSMVFSPLRFMEAKQAWTCLELVLGTEPDWLGDRSVVSVSVELWPEGYTAPSPGKKRSTRCEPDLVAKISFGSESAPLIVVGEMKWDSMNDLKKEILREQDAVKAKYPCAKIASFGLIKYRKDVIEVPNGRVRCWTDLHRDLVKFAKLNSNKNSSAVIWAKEVAQFLVHAEQTIFQGIRVEYKGNAGRPIFYHGF